MTLWTEFCGGHPRLRRVRARISKLVADDPGWLCPVGLVVAFRSVLTECWQLAFPSCEGTPEGTRILKNVVKRECVSLNSKIGACVSSCTQFTNYRLPDEADDRRIDTAAQSSEAAAVTPSSEGRRYSPVRSGVKVPQEGVHRNERRFAFPENHPPKHDRRRFA